MKSARDPICGMTVDIATALQVEQHGEIRYFCGESCREQFVNSLVPSDPAGPCAIVIFGASGDLTKRKLLPSIYHLVANGVLRKEFAIIGVGRRDWSDRDFRGHLREAMEEFASPNIDNELWDLFEDRLSYCSGSYTDLETYRKLDRMLEQEATARETGGNVLFYLSVPPESFGSISTYLGESGLLREPAGNWRRVVIEKPFGHDLASAMELNLTLSKVMAERQVFRIDHYLGKEVSQNLLVFRLGNSIIEPVWNRNHIDSVEITAAESIGVEGRAAFYESTGAFRDMIQTHLLSVMALVSMEPPTSLEGEAVRNEKAKLLDAIRIPSKEEVRTGTVRGRYGEGEVNGQLVPGYLDEPSVPSESTVETYAAIKLWVDNWRWAGVPFYLRTGKRLARRVTEIVIRFKNPPLQLYGKTECSPLGPNLLIMRIQPNEGMTLQMRAKTPGTVTRTRAVAFEFDYSQFGSVEFSDHSTGYEKLLYDCIVGDPTLFHRADMVEAAWEIATPILDGWESGIAGELTTYAAGSWGVKEADRLMGKDGRQWWTM